MADYTKGDPPRIPRKMAFKIRDLLEPRERLLIDRTGAEITRLYGLPDIELATYLLTLARGLRAEFPDQLSDPNGATYEANLVWHLIPEVAKRLGATGILPHEATYSHIATLKNDELRNCVGTYLKHVAIHHFAPDSARDTPSFADIACHDIANGNPVAIAVDRIHPAPAAWADRHDWIARYVREISAARGHEQTPYWSPDLQNKIVDIERDPASIHDMMAACAIPLLPKAP